MAAHYDAAGGGLDRFQPIVTPIGYPGNHYDSMEGIHLNVEDQAGFVDRFWGRGLDPRGSSRRGSDHRGAFLPEIHSSIRSPMCPQCKLPRAEMQPAKLDGTAHVPAIDGVYSSCCCPDIRMLGDKTTTGAHFLRRHSSLWEKGPSSPGPDILGEDEANTTNPLWDTSTRAPTGLSFEGKNMAQGGPSSNSVEGHAGAEDGDHPVVKGGWPHLRRASSELLATRPGIHEDV